MIDFLAELDVTTIIKLDDACASNRAYSTCFLSLGCARFVDFCNFLPPPLYQRPWLQHTSPSYTLSLLFPSLTSVKGKMHDDHHLLDPFTLYATRLKSQGKSDLGWHLANPLGCSTIINRQITNSARVIERSTTTQKLDQHPSVQRQTE